MLDAQAGGCRSVPRRAVAPGWYVGPEAAVATSDGLVVFGDIRYRFLRAVGDDSLEVDSSFVGLYIRGDGRTDPILVPPNVERVRGVRVGERGTATRLAFVAPRLPARESDPLVGLWEGRLVGETVQDVQGIGDLGRHGTFDRQRSSELTEWRGGEHLLFPADWTDNGTINLAHASSVRGNRRVALVRTALSSVTYTELLADGDVLRSAIIGISLDRPTASGPAIWSSEFDGDSWSPVRRIVESRGDMLIEPRLLRTAAGLVLAYLRITSNGQRTLEWVGVGERAPAPIHAMPVLGRLQRGQQALSDLVTVADSESTAVVLRLRSTGADTLAKLRTRGAFSPLLTGRREAPLALTFDDDEKSRLSPFHLVLHDLSCLSPLLDRAPLQPPA